MKTGLRSRATRPMMPRLIDSDASENPSAAARVTSSLPSGLTVQMPPRV